MSYNTRRSGPNPPQQQAASVGQRRPVVTNNFVAASQPSGQQQQQRPPQQQQQQQQRPAQQPAQQASQIQFRQQQQPPVKQQTPAQQQYNQQQMAQRAAQLNQQQRQAPPAAKPAAAPAAAQPAPTQNYQTQSFVKTEPATPSRQTAPVVPGANPPPPDTNNGDSMDTDDATKKKKPWMRGGKISKKEKMRRRNLRLSRMLQPKNAVMILNELVKNTSYTVEELDCKVDNNQYKAVVTFEGEDHVGLGRSKTQAKNSAAEAALKYLIKNKQLKLAKSEPVDDDPMDGASSENMELTTEDGTAVLPWQHVASFALFKLFSSWGEDPMGPVRHAQELLGSASPSAKPPVTPGTRPEMKPAKQLPANPETMNPIMLLNQMQPNVQYEEVGKSGLPPNVTFTYNVFVNDQTFSGTGNNKKVAKKMAAFAACHSVYNIQYPTEVWSPLA